MNTLMNSHLNRIYSDEVQLESMGCWTHGYVGYLFPHPSSHGKKENTFFHHTLPSMMLLFGAGSQLRGKHPQNEMFTIVSQVKHFYFVFYLQVFCGVETMLIGTNFLDKAIQSRHTHSFFYKYLDLGVELKLEIIKVPTF